MTWFDVDKEGLSKLLAKKGKAFAVFELIQNAWDAEGVTTVNVKLEAVPGRPLVILEVEDNSPGGFKDLSHSFKLFAESEKKNDPEKRGRFNLGEKLVLAMAESAHIESVTGGVIFKPDGTREVMRRKKRDAGTCVTFRLRMTREELQEVDTEVKKLIQPANVTTTFNGQPLARRKPVHKTLMILPTVVADGEGNLIRTKRKTQVAVFEPEAGEVASIYEMGIPVVATGDRFHIDVGQKVPVNLDRDNVPPAYLRELRALVLEAVVDRLDKETSSEAWVTDALSHPDIDPRVVESTVTKRFGEKRAIFDPSDTEANMRLVGQGFTVVSGGSLPKAAWENVRNSGAMKPSGTLAPTPKPYSDDPNAEQVELYPRDEWTHEMSDVAHLIEALGHKILDMDIHVMMVKTRMPHNAAAAFGPSGDFSFFVQRIGKAWFKESPLDRILRLVVHEFGHCEGAGHLEDRYHEKLCEVSGKLAKLALYEPELFREFTKKGH